MKKSDKDKIRDIFFRFKEDFDRSPLARKELLTALRIESVIHSNALENHLIDSVMLRSALYSGNVRLSLFSNPAYKKAFLEARGHDKMSRYLQEKALGKSGLTVSFLLKLHKLLFEKSWPEIAGRFRDIDVRIRGMQQRPPHYTQVYSLAYQHLTWIDGLLKLLGPASPGNFFEIFHVAADLQYRIVSTYPFRDGNWRIARSLTDFVLLYCGMIQCVIDYTMRDDYMTAISNCTMTDFTDLEDLMLQCYGETLNRLMSFITLVRQGPE